MYMSAKHASTKINCPIELLMQKARILETMPQAAIEDIPTTHKIEYRRTLQIEPDHSPKILKSCSRKGKLRNNHYP